jgi:hypothetical protein
MPFRQVDTNSPEYANGRVLGLLAATVGMGLWPLVAGVRKGRPLLGIVGFFSCIAGGLLVACWGSFPVALFFSLLIGAMGRPTDRPKPPPRDDW